MSNVVILYLMARVRRCSAADDHGAGGKQRGMPLARGRRL